MSTLNGVGITKIEVSSSVLDFEESDIDPDIMTSFLEDSVIGYALN